MKRLIMGTAILASLAACGEVEAPQRLTEAPPQGVTMPVIVNDPGPLSIVSVVETETPWRSRPTGRYTYYRATVINNGPDIWGTTIYLQIDTPGPDQYTYDEGITKVDHGETVVIEFEVHDIIPETPEHFAIRYDGNPLYRHEINPELLTN